MERQCLNKLNDTISDIYPVFYKYVYIYIYIAYAISADTLHGPFVELSNFMFCHF